MIEHEAQPSAGLALLLRTDGFRTVSASTPQEAIEQALCWLPDVIISEIAVPLLEAVETASWNPQFLSLRRVLFFSPLDQHQPSGMEDSNSRPREGRSESADALTLFDFLNHLQPAALIRVETLS